MARIKYYQRQHCFLPNILIKGLEKLSKSLIASLLSCMRDGGWEDVGQKQVITYVCLCVCILESNILPCIAWKNISTVQTTNLTTTQSLILQQMDKNCSVVWRSIRVTWLITYFLVFAPLPPGHTTHIRFWENTNNVCTGTHLNFLSTAGISDKTMPIFTTCKWQWFVSILY